MEKPTNTPSYETLLRQAEALKRIKQSNPRLYKQLTTSNATANCLRGLPLDYLKDLQTRALIDLYQHDEVKLRLTDEQIRQKNKAWG